jgi:hypothetical protein
MKTLNQIGFMCGTDKATAHNYLNFYQQILEGFNPVDILEIGVLNGASLRMWKLFYPDARVCGIDTNDPIKVEGCEVIQADATDVFYLETLFAGRMFSLIIDDGSHFTKDQQIAFHFLFNNKLSSDGFYIMEDIHTSFIHQFVNSKFTTFDLLTLKYDCEQYWGKGHHYDSGTLIIKHQ